MTLEDAEWIAKVRSNPQVYRFLSQKRGVSPDEQRAWLETPAAKEGFYWKIWSKERSEYLGLISLYDVHDDSAELGRFVCYDSYAAVGAELAVLEFAFGDLKLTSVKCHTAKGNSSVVSLHRRLGFKLLEEHFDELLEMDMVWQELTGKDFKTSENEAMINLLRSKL